MKKKVNFYYVFIVICFYAEARGPRRELKTGGPAFTLRAGALPHSSGHAHAQEHDEEKHSKKHVMMRRWGWPHEPWGALWSSGYIGRHFFQFVLPLRAQKLLYPKGYTQWGQDLDSSDKVLEAAIAGDWLSVKERLSDLRYEAQEKLQLIDAKEATKETYQERQNLKKELNYIQLHLDGITKKESLLEELFFPAEAL